MRETKNSGKIHYMCDECSFVYETRKLAQKCEAWCKEHHSCSLEITKHAVKV